MPSTLLIWVLYFDLSIDIHSTINLRAGADFSECTV
jgi:hypothetical protein